MTVKFDARLRVLINNYAGNMAKIVANSVINSTVKDYLEENKITYSDLLKINTAEDGAVTSVEFDTVTITKLKAGIISLVQSRISKEEKLNIGVPIGTLTGYQILNNRGPKIRISLNISSAIFSKISSTFIDSGINQTLHKITLEINADMYFVMPWYRTTGSFESDFTLAETIIVGKVPDAYTNVIEYPGSDMAGYLFDYSAEPY
jgi:sporulation protein YunB